MSVDGTTTRSEQPTATEVTTVAVCAADDRSFVRTGLIAAIEGAPDPEGYRPVRLRTAARPLAHVGEAVNAGDADATVVVVPLRNQHPEPFRAIATAKALDPDVLVLALIDEVNDTELREAVVAGIDGFLVTTATGPELRRSVIALAHGEQVVSPEVAMHLVDAWRPDGPSPRSSVTPREREVLEHLAEGMTNREIAEQLEVSPRTVKTHVQNLLAKLDVPDRTGAVARAFRLGIIR